MLWQVTQYAAIYIMLFSEVITGRVLFSIIATFIGLPTDLRYNPVTWNAMVHGNITFVIFLFVVR